MKKEKIKYAYDSKRKVIVFGELKWADGVGPFLELSNDKSFYIISSEVATDEPEDALEALKKYAEQRITDHEKAHVESFKFNNKQITYYTDMIRGLYT